MARKHRAAALANNLDVVHIAKQTGPALTERAPQGDVVARAGLPPLETGRVRATRLHHADLAFYPKIGAVRLQRLAGATGREQQQRRQPQVPPTQARVPLVCRSDTIRHYPNNSRAALKLAILAYGINYRTAAIDLRDRVAFPEDTLGNALMAVIRSVPSVTEAVILSTCNRTEIYCAIDPADEVTLSLWLGEYRGVPTHEIQGAAYSYWDQDAARHLIRVAAGLDSQVLGEPQIMGQVKSACELARNLGTLGTELDLLSRISLNTAKRVRTDTDVGRNPVSVAYAAVAMAKRIFSDLSRKAALLIGAGDTIQRVAEHLSEQRIGALAIANRTIANAEKLAARFDAKPMQLTDVGAALQDYDIVITSTGSSLPVVGKGAVEAAIKNRRHRPVFMVDIAVPRDIEPEVADLPDVFLYSIDDLTEIIQENLKQRLSAADSAQTLVDEGAGFFSRERRAHQGQRMLRQLRENAQDAQLAELDKARRSLANGGDPGETIAALAQALTNKLMHPPTAAIREASAEGRVDLLDVLKALYKLD